MGPERCGVILDTGEVLEIPNLHPDPMNGFSMPHEVLEAMNVIASWHTHPRTGPNLSTPDYKAFAAWPRLKHYIVSATEIWSYGVEGLILVAYDDDNLTRPPAGTSPL